MQFHRAGRSPIVKTYKYDPTKQTDPTKSAPISAKKREWLYYKWISKIIYVFSCFICNNWIQFNFNDQQIHLRVILSKALNKKKKEL